MIMFLLNFRLLIVAGAVLIQYCYANESFKSPIISSGQEAYLNAASQSSSIIGGLNASFSESNFSTSESMKSESSTDMISTGNGIIIQDSDNFESSQSISGSSSNLSISGDEIMQNEESFSATSSVVSDSDASIISTPGGSMVSSFGSFSKSETTIIESSSGILDSSDSFLSKNSPLTSSGLDIPDESPFDSFPKFSDSFSESGLPSGSLNPGSFPRSMDISDVDTLLNAPESNFPLESSPYSSLSPESLTNLSGGESTFESVSLKNSPLSPLSSESLSNLLRIPSPLESSSLKNSPSLLSPLSSTNIPGTLSSFGNSPPSPLSSQSLTNFPVSSSPLGSSSLKNSPISSLSPQSLTNIPGSSSPLGNSPFSLLSPQPSKNLSGVSSPLGLGPLTGSPYIPGHYDSLNDISEMNSLSDYESTTENIMGTLLDKNHDNFISPEEKLESNIPSPISPSSNTFYDYTSSSDYYLQSNSPYYELPESPKLLFYSKPRTGLPNLPGISPGSFQSYPPYLKNGPPFPHYLRYLLPYSGFPSPYSEYPLTFSHYPNIPKQPSPNMGQNSPNPFFPRPRILSYPGSSTSSGYDSLSQSSLPLNGLPSSLYPSPLGMSPLSRSMKSPSSLSPSYPFRPKGISPSSILENESSISPLNSLSASPSNLSGSSLSSSPLSSSSLGNSVLSPLSSSLSSSFVGSRSLSSLSPSDQSPSSSSRLSPSSIGSSSHLSPSEFLSSPSPLSPSLGPSDMTPSALGSLGLSPSIPFHPKPSGGFPLSPKNPMETSGYPSSFPPSPLGHNFSPSGKTTKDNLTDEIFESLRQQYELNRLNYINQNTYPVDISGTIDYSNTPPIYNYVLLGTGPGSLSALKTLLDTGKQVLLIERGYSIPYQSISLYQRGSLFHSSYVRPVKATAPHVDTLKTIYLPNVLGEESTYDFNYWHNGYRRKYNLWGKLYPKWSWNEVMNYFIGRDESSPDTCPILYTHRIPETQAVDVVTKLFQEIGISPKSYTPGKLPEGLTVIPRLEENGNNVIYAQKVFQSLVGRSNLHLALRTTPKNIVFDVNGRAMAINVITPYGNERTIIVQDEVIFGSNAIDTVQLLYQSGVGPSEKLLQNNIQPQIDLSAVGKGLLLLPSFNGLLYTFPSETLLNKWESDWASLEYLLGQNQFPSILALNYYKAMLNIYESSNDSNVMINFRVFSKYTKERLRAFIKHFSYVDESIESFLLELCETRDILFVIPTLTDVQSRGEIFINNPLNLDEPIIDTGMYKSKKDIAIMMKTLKVLISLSQTEAFQTLNGEIVQLPIKQCGTPNFSSQYNKCAIRYLSTPNCHFIGGALMGNDPMNSVVNEDLLVHYTQNVRIFNSAVMQYGTGVDSSAVNGMIGIYGAQILVQNVVN